LSLGRSELIGVHGKLPCEKVHSQGRVLPDRSVSYKYMNPNLVVVVTGEPEVGNINVFLVDAVSGKMNGINLFLIELLYSYFKLKFDE